MIPGVTPERSYPIPWRRRLTVRLTGGVILVLLAIGVPFLLAFQRLLRQQQYDTLAETTHNLSALVVDGLRSSMTAGQPHLFDQTIRNLAGKSEIERVILLDHRGSVKVSSDRTFEGRVLDRGAESTCVVCHRESRAPTSNWTIVGDRRDGRVFRTVTVIANEERCHGCHDPAVRTNGILLMDLSLRELDERYFAGLGSTLSLGAVMVVLTVGVLALLLRRLVLSPLQEVVSTSQRIVGGDLDSRAAVSAPGEFAHLAWQVNRMTDHLARSIRVVDAQRADLQAILDAIDDEVVVLDRDRRILAANEAFRARSGRSESEVTGLLCGEASSQQWPCGVDEPGGCPVRRVFETGRLEKGMLSRTLPDGSERIVEIHASPLPDAEGVVAGVVEVRRDISERRQMEAILAHSEHLASLGLLASGLSHEINNPLGVIATLVQGLRRRLPTDERLSGEAAAELDDLLRRVGAEVERGRTITNRLLKIARPAQGRRGLVDVRHVIDDVVALLGHDIERAAIAVERDFGEGIPLFHGDEAQITQIVMNVALNAIQAMARGSGRLVVRAWRDDGAITIEIVDTGDGIAPEVMKRIFEPFFTTKPAGKGTGLGLFITHQIVSDLGGTIAVRSEPGAGTTVSIRLPPDEETAR